MCDWNGVLENANFLFGSRKSASRASLSEPSAFEFRMLKVRQAADHQSATDIRTHSGESWNHEAMQHRLTVSIHPMPRDEQAVRNLRERLERIPGVRSVSIHAQTEMAYVVCDSSAVSADVIAAAIDRARSAGDEIEP
jgi:copper chaperone CopZ